MSLDVFHCKGSDIVEYKSDFLFLLMVSFYFLTELFYTE